MKSASTCHSEDVGTGIRVRFFLLGDDVSNDIVCFVSVSDLNKCVQHAGLRLKSCNNGRNVRGVVIQRQSDLYRAWRDARGHQVLESLPHRLTGDEVFFNSRA